MTKPELMRQFYKECMDIEFDETSELIKSAETKDERDFIKLVTDFVLQAKQKAAIDEKRF